jgi:hypothetical protein
MLGWRFRCTIKQMKITMFHYRSDNIEAGEFEHETVCNYENLRSWIDESNSSAKITRRQ